MQLDKMQRAFKEHMFATIEAVEVPEEKFAALFDVGNIALDTRLKIYRNHIITTLSDVLVMNFPMVEILTGEDFLKTAAKFYLFDHPPREACLDRYGQDFPAFLAEYEHAAHLPYLGDMARLDWAMNESRTAKQDETLKAQDLAQINPDNLESSVFKVKKSVRLLESAYPLDVIYRFCEEKSEESETLDIDAQTDHGKTYILVTRLGWDPKIFKLEKSEYQLLLGLKQERALGECLGEVMYDFPTFDFAGFLQNYIGLETFAEVVAK
ncbi:MAG: DNA-binding domain-containing protein [Alphaproteobacteria bacterium]|nr:DNA-binding domain-containing protein [Alphaproteobacteria bacterium]